MSAGRSSVAEKRKARGGEVLFAAPKPSKLLHSVQHICCLVGCRRSVAEKRKARGGEVQSAAPQDTPEVLLEKLGFPRKKQYQKVSELCCNIIQTFGFTECFRLCFTAAFN